MFLASDKANVRRVFQKPNILRKKPKAQELPPPPSAPPEPDKPAKTKAGKHRCSKPCHTTRKPSQRIRLDSYMCEEYRLRKLLGEAEAAQATQQPAAPPVLYIGCESVDEVPETETVLPTHQHLPESVVQKEESHTSDLVKCTIEGCGQWFSAAQLDGHVSSHRQTRAPRPRPPPTRQLLQCCPAKRNDSPRCEVIFQCRDDLLRHLREDHTEEDAPYKCETCGRSFFWFSGLRAHARVHDTGPRSVYRCAWPGCERVFAQACRLKEHGRSHTGDKPYPCLYPSCGWAFRTASKLLRHTRRHTGERRFACLLCGAAFLRAEHLREHEARHTHRLHRHKHACTAEGCEQKFTNKSSLYMHMKRVHPPPPAPPPPSPPPPPPPVVSLPTINIGSDERPPEDRTCRAARTHVPWPPPPGLHAGAGSDDEDSVPGVYTGKSDLFLHSDAHNDDSQACLGAGLELVLLAGGGGGGGEEGGGYCDGLADSDLGLLDPADPINHLLQEELMLTDATADESPFQLLVLNGN